MTSAGELTRLRRMSFTLLPFESAGSDGLTSEDRVDRASEMASGPWVTAEDDRSASLAAVEVWSSPMPESYRRRETPFSTSSPAEMAPLSKKTPIRRGNNVSNKATMSRYFDTMRTEMK
ncbi:hypothetical protein EYF80_000176 [Liparis tanakae]|uniref:Uncharacterized protein n=1 Tax=Liparis tanakae TaxID=230148 RepID=A0A4Z2JID4_9TELE|nr:hypothetical protein EYF80_000176 [Liparis tanakae]